MKGVGIMTILKKIVMALVNLICGAVVTSGIFGIIYVVVSCINPQDTANMLKAVADDYKKYN
jgi:hypothetical protein